MIWKNTGWSVSAHFWNSLGCRYADCARIRLCVAANHPVFCMESLDYAVRLATLNLYSVKGRLLRSDLIKCFKIFSNLSDLFTPSSSVNTHGHRFKVLKPHVTLDSRRRFLGCRYAAVRPTISCLKEENRDKRKLFNKI